MLELLLQTVHSGHRFGSGYLYLIHFEDKRHHAQHYLGSSLALMQRLGQHANGQGARITHALWEDAEHWQLAALYIPRHKSDSIRDLERRAKTRKHSATYCPLCMKGEHQAPPGTIEYPRPTLSSRTLRKDIESP